MGGKVNTALSTVWSRSWMIDPRMDTGMRETLQMAMGQLVKDVSIDEGLISHVPPSDSFTWKRKQGPRPDHAGKVDVAKGDC